MAKFLHMHHVMANRAYMMESTRKDANPWKRDNNVLRDIVMSGKVDYRGETVTQEDREIVLRYLNVEPVAP